MRAHSPSGGSVFSATVNQIRLAIEQCPSPAQGNATIKLKYGVGWANMNEIIARVLLVLPKVRSSPGRARNIKRREAMDAARS
jgi:hypothetical protein